MKKLKNILLTGITIGSLALLPGCGKKIESSEMKTYGFEHLSQTEIKYSNGFVAKIAKYNDEWDVSEIRVIKGYISCIPIVRIYTPENEYFKEIKRNILGKSKPLLEEK